MPDLESKFLALETQIADQHDAIAIKLDALLEAMGVAPPTPTATLADTLALMIAMNNNLIGMAIANGSFHTSVLELLGLINTNTDTMITNNSLNAQRMIAALYATFCDCDTDTPLLAPPIDITPTSLVDEAKCRRIQFYLSVFGNWLNSIANYGNAGAAITGGALATLLAVVVADAGIVAVGAEVGAVAGPPGIVIGAVVGLITVAVYTLGGAQLVQWANEFNDATLRDNMVQAMYAATNADEGYTAFKTVLLAGMSTIPAEIIYTLWWSAWSNDIYSGVPVVDDSAFDGTICLPESECEEFTSNTTTTNVNGTYYVLTSADPYGPNPTTFTSGNYHGYTVKLLSGSRVQGVAVSYYNASAAYNFGAMLTDTNDSYTIPVDTVAIGYFSSTESSDGHFTIEVCPPS